MKNRPPDRPLPLLAHLVPCLGAVEPAATQALASLLRCPPTARRRVRLLAATGLDSFRAGPIRAAEGRFEEAPVKGNYLYLPIRLTTGVDRGRVIDDAVGQLRHFGERLREAFPDESSPGEVREPEGPA